MNKTHHSIPRLVDRILHILFTRDYYLERFADLEEVYVDQVERAGPLKARFWLWNQIFKLVCSVLRKNTVWSFTMLKFYIKTAVRNLFKSKSLSFINVTGLSVGMVVCLLLMLYVRDELSFDRYHQHSDRIFRILENDSPYTSPQVSGMVRDNFPEIERSARILVRDQCTIQYEEKQFIEKQFCLADPDLFSIFSFKLKKGNPAVVLKRPFSIVISETIARKYFGDEEPIGKVLRLENRHDYMVTGLMEEMPHNSHFRYDLLATLAGAERVFGSHMMTNWGFRNFITYLLIRDHFSRTSFEKKVSPFIAEHREFDEGETPSTFSLQALKKIHLYSGFIDNDIQVQGNISHVLIFSGIGVLILLIACFNYVNLLTANATTRAREVAIKKVVGSTRSQLVRQFLGESIVILMISLCLAMTLSYLCLPVFNGLTGKSLSFSALLSGPMVLWISAVLVSAGLLSGFYPAFVLSSFLPVKTLKGIKSRGHTKLNFIKVIVGIQFAISIILIICALFMARQLLFLRNEELGYDKEHIIVTEIHDSFRSQKYELLKDKLLQNNSITSMTAASRIPTDDLNNWGTLQLPGQSEKLTVPFVHVNFDYFKTFGISAVQGRLFSSQIKTDKDQALILNETAAKRLGLDDETIGKRILISWPSSDRRIIGIVKDFHFESLYHPIQPVAFVIYPRQCWKTAIKVRASHLNETLFLIKKTWKAFYPEWVFEHQFVDDRVKQYYESEEKTFQLMGYFTSLAIFVACLGLFGLISFIIKRRFKEISIRKVLGAQAAGIFALLSRELLLGILLSNLVAWPVAWYSLNKWLQNFAYRTSLSLWIFVSAGMSVLAVALLTMSWQTIRAARSNPIDALKYE
ncbi:MAG: ABC transporter permease [Candidatus Aminicenantes bacterium]|nr:ABC transporter permease [Candidatus Aminicenantes bacterium]